MLLKGFWSLQWANLFFFNREILLKFDIWKGSRTIITGRGYFAEKVFNIQGHLKIATETIPYFSFYFMLSLNDIHKLQKNKKKSGGNNSE